MRPFLLVLKTLLVVYGLPNCDDSAACNTDGTWPTRDPSRCIYSDAWQSCDCKRDMFASAGATSSGGINRVTVLTPHVCEDGVAAAQWDAGIDNTADVTYTTGTTAVFTSTAGIGNSFTLIIGTTFDHVYVSSHHPTDVYVLSPHTVVHTPHGDASIQIYAPPSSPPPPPSWPARCIYVVGDSVQSGNLAKACPSGTEHIASSDECQYEIPEQVTPPCNLPMDLIVLAGGGMYEGATECFLVRNPYQSNEFQTIHGGVDYETFSTMVDSVEIPNFKAPLCRITHPPAAPPSPLPSPNSPSTPPPPPLATRVAKPSEEPPPSSPPSSPPVAPPPETQSWVMPLVLGLSIGGTVIMSIGWLALARRPSYYEGRASNSNTKTPIPAPRRFPRGLQRV